MHSKTVARETVSRAVHACNAWCSKHAWRQSKAWRLCLLARMAAHEACLLHHSCAPSPPPLCAPSTRGVRVSQLRGNPRPCLSRLPAPLRLPGCTLRGSGMPACCAVHAPAARYARGRAGVLRGMLRGMPLSVCHAPSRAPAAGSTGSTRAGAYEGSWVARPCLIGPLSSRGSTTCWRRTPTRRPTHRYPTGTPELLA